MFPQSVGFLELLFSPLIFHTRRGGGLLGCFVFFYFLYIVFLQCRDEIEKPFPLSFSLMLLIVLLQTFTFKTNVGEANKTSVVDLDFLILKILVNEL